MSRNRARLLSPRSVLRCAALCAGAALAATSPVLAGDIMDIQLPLGLSPVTLLALVGGATSVGFLLLVGLIDQLKEGGCPEGLKRVLGAVGAKGILVTALLFVISWPLHGYPEPDLAKTWAPEAQQVRLDGLAQLADYGSTGEEGKVHVPIARAMESLMQDSSQLGGKALEGPSWETLTPAERGEKIYAGLAGAQTASVVGYAACKTCHTTDGSRLVGPSFKGRWGTEVATTTGPVTFDRAYLKESLYEPMKKVADTYPPAMPPQQLTDELIDALIAYLETLN